MHSEKKKPSSIEFQPNKILLSKDNELNYYHSAITVYNKSGGHLAIKVKTNAPDAYIVKPNKFVLGPLSKIDLKITYQASTSTVYYRIDSRIRLT